MDFLKNASIKKRLWVIMCTMALMMLFGGGVGLVGIAMTDDALESTYKDSLEPTSMISKMMLLMGENRIHIILGIQDDSANPYFDVQSNSDSVHVASVIKNRDIITSIIREFQKRNLTKEEKFLAEEYTKARMLYVNDGLMPAVAALQEKDYQKTNKILLNKINPYYKTASLRADILLRKIHETARTNYEEASDRFILIRNILICSTLLGILFASISATLLIRSIVRPLNKAVIHFKRIANGNLDENISVSRQDEIGQVLSELAAMQGKLKIMIGELDRLASTDKLTGAWNRRRFEEIIETEMDRLRRYGNRLSLMILDVDHFKKINDHYGHATGDQVLVDLSNTIRSSLRSSDSLTRWGGEEFVILCPNTTLSIVSKLAERLRKKIATINFQQVESITVSFGVAECGPSETWEQWLHRADEALYLAKSGGRDQVKAVKKLSDLIEDVTTK
ncbi:MAG: diguanylate cyclase [Betaproteobacteria bacterium]|nr:MAG: diguanylate cyclase [Betaproteobacteria bacterium]